MGANETGLHGESLAAEFLTRRGYRVIDRNYHSRYGEVDIIALSDAYIVFVEVKVRQAGGKLHPTRYLRVPSKCRKLVKTALLYLQTHPEYQELQPRFDVAAITIEPRTNRKWFDYLSNVFEADEGWI